MNKSKIPSRFLLLIILTGGLSACTHIPLPTQHSYLLRHHSMAATPAAELFQVKNVTVPIYLRGEPLILLVSPQEIRPALHHRWAEPLDMGIKRYLQSQLNESWSAAGRTSTEKPRTIKLSIDELLGTVEGIIRLRSSYEITARSNGEMPVTGSFDKTVKQGVDGYSGMVEGYKELLNALSDSIVGQLNAEQ